VVHNVFISYATKDGLELARRADAFLSEELLLDVFLADRSRAPGQDIDLRLRAELLQSRCVLALFTPEALKSKWVLGEVDLALDKDKPLVVCRDERVRKEDLPLRVQPMEHIVFSDPDALAEALKTQVPWGIPVIVPAAGRAYGLYPLNIGMPKIVLPIGEKPMLHYIVDKLDPQVFSRVCVITKRFSRMVEYYAGLADADIPVQCLVTPARTLPAALKKIAPKTTFMVHYSDIILEGNVDWRDFVGFHNFNRTTHGVLGTLMASSRYRVAVGHIIPNSSINRLVGQFTEKPTDSEPSGYYVNMAVSIFEPEFLHYVEESHSSLYGDSLASAIEDDAKFALYPHGQWRHIQTLGDWFDAQEHYFQEDSPAWE